MTTCLLTLSSLGLTAGAASGQNVWSEQGDADELPGTAQTVLGYGELNFILGSLNPADLTDIDMYRFRIAETAAFSVNMTGTPVVDANQKDTQLYLFDHEGRYVTENDDLASGSLLSEFTPGSISGFDPGEYYLAVGLFNNDPVYENGSSSNPVVGWDQNVQASEGGDYRLNFTATTFINDSPSPLERIAFASGDSAGFETPTINDAGDVAFYADNYTQGEAIYADYRGFGEISATDGVTGVVIDGTPLLETSTGFVVGDPADHPGSTQHGGVFADREFAFNRYGVYQRASLDTDGDPFTDSQAAIQIGDATASGRSVRIRLGDTSLAEIDVSSSILPFESLNDISVGQNADHVSGWLNTIYFPDSSLETSAQFSTLQGGAFQPDENDIVSYEVEGGSIQTVSIFPSDSYGILGNTFSTSTDNGNSVYSHVYIAIGIGAPFLVGEYAQTSDFLIETEFDDRAHSDAGTLVLAPNSSRIYLAETDQTILQTNGNLNTAAGTLNQLGKWIQFNNAGDVVTPAFVDTQSVYLSTNIADPAGSAKVLLRHNQEVSDGNGRFVVNANSGAPFPFTFHLNNGGQLLFESEVAGSSTSNRGLFLTDGIDTLTIARINRELDPFSTLTDFELRSGADSGGQQAFNDWGQVAFKAIYDYNVSGIISESREGVFVYTPELSFRELTPGDTSTTLWDRAENWTLSIAPAPVHHVTVGSARFVNDLDTETHIRSLQLDGVLGTSALHTFRTEEDFTLADAGALQIAGLPAATGPAFVVGGGLHLDGSLLLLGFDEAEAGDLYTLFEAEGGITGQFASVEAPLLDGSLSLTVLYDANAVRLAIESLLLAGDYDASGDVGAEDLALVLANWGADVVDGEVPDANWTHTDGVTAPNIGADELALVLANWGNTTAIPQSLADITAVTGLDERRVRQLVPEPAAGLVLLLAMPVWRRRKSTTLN
jgi:hypothetical protein